MTMLTMYRKIMPMNNVDGISEPSVNEIKCHMMTPELKPESCVQPLSWRLSSQALLQNPRSYSGHVLVECHVEPLP